MLFLSTAAGIYACEFMLNSLYTHIPGEFDDLLSKSETRSEADPSEGIVREFCNINDSSASNGSIALGRGQELLMLENLTLMAPSKATLIRDLSLEIFEKEHLLVSTLLSCC